MPNHATAIEWMTALADSRGMRADVWNWAEGCTAAGDGCRNCWAAAEVYIRGHQSGRTGERFAGLSELRGTRPVFNGAVRIIEADLTKPLRTKRPTVYFCSRFDPLHEAIDDATRDRAIAIMALCPQHLFLILTKRPERMREYLTANTGLLETGHACGRIADAVQSLRRDNLPVGPLPHIEPGAPWWPLPNVWLGTSVENQAAACERRDPMRALAEAGWFTWVSSEPRLGPIDWTGWEFIRWLVTSGESGRGARPCHPDWPRSDRDQCQAAGVPFYFKQWGEWKPTSSVDAYHHGSSKNKREYPSSDGISMLADGRICLRDFSVAEHRRRIASGLAKNTRAVEVDLAALKDFHRSIEDEARTVDNPLGYQWMYRVGKKTAGRLLDGVEHTEVPHVIA